ncbi:hypothetical protein [Hydrogenimonas sp.]
MQRNIADQKTLTTFLALSGLLLYPSMAAFYPLIPPLLGFVYVKWRRAVEREDLFEVSLWMLYALVFESVWNLPLYGIWTVMIVTFHVFDPKAAYLIHSGWLLNVIGVLIFDLLYFLFLYAYEVVMHTKVIDTDLILLYYLLVDIAGVLLF